LNAVKDEKYLGIWSLRSIKKQGVLFAELFPDLISIGGSWIQLLYSTIKYVKLE